jgi:hypothetical protein
VQSERPCYRVDFSDGESIVCDADHLWTVEDRYSRQNPVTLPTSTMAERYLLPDSRNRVSRRYRLPMTLPLQVPAAGLPIDPYTLGVWLGDGTSENAIVTLNADDAEFIAAVVRQSCFESASWRHWESHKGHSRVALLTGTGRSDSFRSRLRRLGVPGEKHIPQDYLRASVSQRMCLLQGLMDTDGSVRLKTATNCGRCLTNRAAMRQRGYASSTGTLPNGSRMQRWSLMVSASNQMVFVTAIR